MLKIEHLTKKYGEKTAVEDLSLHIQKGEIYGFIGHNGAGKLSAFCSLTKERFGSMEILFGKCRLPAKKRLRIFRIIRIYMIL